jgi:hypothetical protein
MALAAFVESIESVPEHIRDEYVEDTELGGYKLNVQEAKGFVLENVDALKSALSKERKSRSDFEKQLTSLKTKYVDIDVDAAKEAMQKLAEFEKFNPQTEAEKIAQEKYEAQKKRLENSVASRYEAQIKNEYEPLKEKYKIVESQLKKEMVTGSALAAISAEDGDVDLLLPHVVGKMKFEMNDKGAFETLVVGSDGEPMYNNKGQPMTPRELVSSLKTKFPAAFKSNAKAGGGVKSTEGIQPSNNTMSFADALRNAPPGGRII